MTAVERATSAPAGDGSAPRFASLFETYLDAVYDGGGSDPGLAGRQGLVGSISERMVEAGATTVLDCAAGTGFPALDLVSEPPGADGFEIHCTDSDPDMIEQLVSRARHELGATADRRLAELVPPRARAMRPESNPFVLDWCQLDDLASRYDYVMCRGNSLVYATTWGGGVDVATPSGVRAYLQRIADRVRPGGYLHIDAPQGSAPVHRTFPAQRWEAGKVQVRESIVPDHARQRREWTIDFEFTDGSEPLRFVRYSTLLTVHHVSELLAELGFERTEPTELAHERSGFGVIIARRPG